MARAFLCYVPDALISRVVRPVVAFEWGFWVRGGVVEIKELKKLGLDAWNGHLEFIRSQYEGWRFEKSEDSLNL